MPKTKKSHKQRFTSFKNGFCPYCGSSGATLEELVTCGKRVKTARINHTTGYRGACINPDCKAENFFTNDKAKEW